MFIQNKYTNWYYNIVNRAKTRTMNTYTESHHIIPKSLGGTNQVENLVNLTAKEHYVCHRLLTKITTGEAKTKMLCAAMIMMHGIDSNRSYRISSTAYEQVKAQRATALSLLKKGKPGHPRSEATRAKMSASRTGKTLSPETREKIRLAALGRKHTEATKEKFKNRISNRLGVILTEETKAKMRKPKQKKLVTV